jgi:Uncharacterised protein family (UPF0158)
MRRIVKSTQMPNSELTDQECRGVQNGASRCQLPISWDALEAAFENTAPDVHSYLHVGTGEVVRVIADVSDASVRARVVADVNYRLVPSVSSREQYRWIARFIATVEESSLREWLSQSIDGKGAFRRFKAALMADAVERERWLSFRSERLRLCMEDWLYTQGIEAVEHPARHLRSAMQVQQRAPHELLRQHGGTGSCDASEPSRSRARRLVEALPVRELELACAFLRFLAERASSDALREAQTAGEDGDAARDRELDGA